MKSKWARVMILSIVGILTSGTLALANDGAMTDIEKRWLDFRRAVSDQQVKDGILTKEQAKSQLTDLESRLKGEGDSIYEKFAKRFAVDGKAKRERGSEGKIVRLYAKLTGRDEQAVRQACEQNKISVWELARREGNSENLKSQVLSIATQNLDQKVLEGAMTRQQREEVLRKIADSLQSAEPNLA